jgi:hypothetical protein
VQINNIDVDGPVLAMREAFFLLDIKSIKEISLEKLAVLQLLNPPIG